METQDRRLLHIKRKLLELPQDLNASKDRETFDKSGVTDSDMDHLISIAFDPVNELWARIHALNFLPHLALVNPKKLSSVITLLADDSDFVQQAAFSLLENPAYFFALCESLSDTSHVYQTPRVCLIVLRLAAADSKRFDAALTALLVVLQKSSDALLNANVLMNIMQLHGMDPEKYMEDDYQGPKVCPKPSTVAVVRDCFARKMMDVSVSGGFIDFLECGWLPADPNDNMVSSLHANYSEDDLSLEPQEVEKFHNQRMEDLKEHWNHLHRLRRAQQLTTTINKALIVVLILACYYLLTSLFASQSEEIGEDL